MRWMAGLVGCVLAVGALTSYSYDVKAQEVDDRGAATPVERCFGDMPRCRMRELARRAGPLRVRGGERLSGLVFAESVHVEAGAPVEIEAGTSIYSLGDIRIDAPLRGVAPRTKRSLKPGTIGFDGHDTPGVVFICEQGDFTQSETILLNDGEPGGDVDIIDTSGVGGAGGDGGGIRIECPGTVTILANVVPGRGGLGGSAHVVGHAGAPGRDGETVRSACGGVGGNSGDVRITAHRLVFETDQDGKPKGKIVLRPGGVGGEGSAEGGAGGDAAFCFLRSGHGGTAIARGGAAGRSTRALIQVDELVPEDLGAIDIAGFLLTERADGGHALAVGGKGGDALCFLETTPETACPAHGRKGGKGGFGGDALAVGGRASTGGLLGGGSGALRDRERSGAETAPGRGGDADAIGGDAGFGGFGENGRAPGRGGVAGNAGDGVARAGAGAPAVLGKGYYDLPSAGVSPLAGGDGGNASALGGDGGAGGKGGDCCGHPGGKGAAGGLGGARGNAKAVPGSAGPGLQYGNVGLVFIESKGLNGANGAKGADCAPAGPGGGGSGVTVDLVVTPSPALLGGNVTYVATLTNPAATAATGLHVDAVYGTTIFEDITVDVPAHGTVHLEFTHVADRLVTAEIAEIRVDGHLAVRVRFDVVNGPCSVVFEKTDIDFGNCVILVNHQCLLRFNVTNPNPYTVKADFSQAGTDDFFIDPLSTSGRLTLAPGETHEIEAGFVPGHAGSYQQQFTVCGQVLTLHGTASEP